VIIDTRTTRIEPTADNPDIGLGFGYELETGDEVLFSGDIRLLTDVAIELIRGNTVTCSIEPEQVIQRRARMLAGQPVP
jgi:hypothetical protein